MASCLNAIFLLWFLQHGGRQVAGQESFVQQKPLIQVAFVNETVSMICEVKVLYKNEYTRFTISYSRVDSEDKEVIIQNFQISEKIPPGKENQTEIKHYKHEIGPLRNTSATGIYYCQAQWTSETHKGNGIFILVRDTGYEESPPGTWTFLIALTTILSILSVSETAVLLWKRKTCHFVSHPKLVACPGMSFFQRYSEPSTAPQAPPGSSEPPASIYASLESHQADIYSVLENDTNSLSLEKNPTAKLQDMIGLQPDKAGNKNEECEKTRKKKKKKKEKKSQQETPEEPSDMLYENI